MLQSFLGSDTLHPIIKGDRRNKRGVSLGIVFLGFDGIETKSKQTYTLKTKRVKKRN